MPDIFANLSVEDAYAVWVAFLAAVVAWLYYHSWWLRRKAIQAFAALHGLRFEGMVVPDGRAPYIHFAHLKWSVLLQNAAEGTWEGLEVAVFEMKPSQKVTRTAAIVRTPTFFGDGRQPGTDRCPVVLTAADLVYVQSHRRLRAAGLPGFLSVAVALARALSAAAPPPPAPERKMFGDIGA